VKILRFYREKVKGGELSSELIKLGRLLGEELRLMSKNKRFLVFVILMILPVLILTVTSLLFWLPASSQNIELMSIVYKGRDLTEVFSKEFEETVKSLYSMIIGYWLGFPILIVTAIFASEFIAGERSTGTFDLFATKPVLRSWLFLPKILAFAIISFLTASAVYLTLVLIVSFSFFSFSFTALKMLSKVGWLIFKYIGVTWMFIMAICNFTVLLSSFTKRTLFAVFGVLAYSLGCGIAVSLISQLIPGTLGEVISQKLSYLDITNDASYYLGHIVFGEKSPIGYLVTMNPTICLAAVIGFITIPLIVTIITLEYKDLL